MQSSVAAVGAPDPTPEPATVEEAVMTSMVRVGKRLRQRFPGEELDFSLLLLLRTVAHLGSVRLSALATVVDLDASTVSRHVKALVDRGLLERSNDPDDRRASQVSVSEAGLARIGAGVARRRELIGSALADWSGQDRDDLRRLLHQLSLALENQDNRG